MPDVAASRWLLCVAACPGIAMLLTAQSSIAAPDLRCQLPLGVVSRESRLIDMSLDGRARFCLAIPPFQPVAVDIEIKHVVPTILPDGERATRIGCRIVGADGAMDKLIATFIIDFK